jgi:hypothetical protein
MSVSHCGSFPNIVIFTVEFKTLSMSLGVFPATRVVMISASLMVFSAIYPHTFYAPSARFAIRHIEIFARAGQHWPVWVNTIVALGTSFEVGIVCGMLMHSSQSSNDMVTHAQSALTRLGLVVLR